MFQKVARLKWAREVEARSQTTLWFSNQQKAGLVCSTAYIRTLQKNSVLDLQGIADTPSQQHSELTPTEGSFSDAPGACGVSPSEHIIKTVTQPLGRLPPLKGPSWVALGFTNTAATPEEKPIRGCNKSRLHTSTQIFTVLNTISPNSLSINHYALWPKHDDVAVSQRGLQTVSDASVESQKDPWPTEIKVQKKGKVRHVSYSSTMYGFLEMREFQTYCGQAAKTCGHRNLAGG